MLSVGISSKLGKMAFNEFVLHNIYCATLLLFKLTPFINLILPSSFIE